MLPPVKVREVLEAARRAGVPFSAAWPLALAGVDEQWLEALHGTRNAWARAYRREPLRPPERALDLVARGDAGELADLDAPARCPTCGNTFEPHPRAPVVIYCSRRCQKHAADRRDRGRDHVARDLAAA